MIYGISFALAFSFMIKYNNSAMSFFYTAILVYIAIYMITLISKFLLLAITLLRSPIVHDGTGDTNEKFAQGISSSTAYVFATDVGYSSIQVMNYTPIYTDRKTGERFGSLARAVMTKNTYVAQGSEIVLANGFFEPQIMLLNFIWIWKFMRRVGARLEVSKYFSLSAMDYWVNPLRLYWGTETDAQEVYQQVLLAAAPSKHDSIVLWGKGRGCSSIIYALPEIMATNTNNSSNKDSAWSKIKGIVLESPIVESLQDFKPHAPIGAEAAPRLIQKLEINAKKLAKKVASIFGLFNPNSLTTIKTLQTILRESEQNRFKFPQILFISYDRTCTDELEMMIGDKYDQWCKIQHIVRNSEVREDIFLNVVHNFYKSIGVPFIKENATSSNDNDEGEYPRANRRDDRNEHHYPSTSSTSSSHSHRKDTGNVTSAVSISSTIAATEAEKPLLSLEQSLDVV